MTNSTIAFCRAAFAILLIGLFSPIISQGQTVDRLDIPVVMDGALLDNAWAGGLDAPQFSGLDLNNDGLQDLYVFDRKGDRHLPFLNVGESGSPDYRFAPEYIQRFPPCENWVLLRDFNGDGAVDLFTSYTFGAQGISVFRGAYDTEEKLVFEQMEFPGQIFNILYFETIGGNQTNLYVTEIDIPVIDDVDGDGDLDILTFSINGGYVEYFKNRSVENDWGLDSLDYKKTDICWGKFLESFSSESISLSDNPNSCSTGLWGGGVSERHTGSTLALVDMESDGDQDLILGDISSRYFVLLMNGGDAEDAYITSLENQFPASDVSVNIPNFPAPFILDIDDDGKKDLIGAAHDLGITPNYESAWFYKDTGTGGNVDFTLQKKDFLTESMLDLGSAVHPAFFDYNADGLIDLLVGTEGFFDESNTIFNRDPRLVLLENTGSATEPAFEVVDDDYLGLSQYAEQTWGFVPAFGDLDADGDKDLVLGEWDGRIFFVENLGGAGNPASFNQVDFAWKGIDVGQFSAPYLIDLNRDGLLDLVVGERNGNINYFPNIGTTQEPDFHPESSEAPNIAALGFMTTTPQFGIVGNSKPVVLDTGEDFLVFAGSEPGGIHLWSNLEGNFDGQAIKETVQYGGLQEGWTTALAFADLNDDGFLEMAIGNSRGGLGLFSTELDASNLTRATEVFDVLQASIRPNPATEQLTIRLGESVSLPVEMTLYDAIGQPRFTTQITQFEQEVILPKLSQGLYFVHLRNEAGEKTEKVVVGEK